MGMQGVTGETRGMGAELAPPALRAELSARNEFLSCPCGSEVYHQKILVTPYQKSHIAYVRKTW